MKKPFCLPSVFVVAQLVVCLGFFGVASAQELSSEQESNIKKISRAVDKSGSFFKDKNYSKSAGQIREALRLMDKLSGDGDVVAAKLKKDYQRIAKAQELLTAKGESFDPLPTFDELFQESGEDATNGSSSIGDGSGSKSEGSGSKSGEKVSFVKHVAPILVEHCGQCHIDQKLGRYSVETYTSVRKKSHKGIVVKSKDADASRLISLVESGKMPKKKPRLPDDQIQILKDWINQGAKFDGNSRGKKESLKSFVSQSEGSASKGSSSKGSGSKGSSKR